MNLVAFLVVGLIAGFLAGKIVDGHGFGVIGDIIVGIVGAFIGGLLTPQFFGPAYGFWGAVGVATLGAVILLFVAHLISGRTHRVV